MAYNILDTYFMATEDDVREGMSWYTNAWSECEYISYLYPAYTPLQVAGVMAVVSPGMVWEENESAPARICELHANGVPPSFWTGFSTYPNNLVKASRILDGDLGAVTGRKVVNFFGNIGGVTDCVTVDRWAIRVALSNPYLSGDMIVPSSQKSYNMLADAYVAAAGLEAINPCDMQAVTWLTLRRMYYGKVDPRKREALTAPPTMEVVNA